MSVSLLVALLAIFFGMTSVIIMAIYRDHNSSKQLEQLIGAIIGIDKDVAYVTSQIPGTIGNTPSLITKNITFNQCITVGNGLCSNLTSTYLATLNNLTNIYTIGNLNATYIQVINECTYKTNVLQMMILMVSPGTNPPVLLSSGNSTIYNTTVFYSIYKVKIGNELYIYYLVLQPWTITVTVPILNPVLSMPLQQCVGSSVSVDKTPFLKVQGSMFSNVNLLFGYEQFCDRIDFYGNGLLSVGTFSLNSPLMLLIN